MIESPELVTPTQRKLHEHYRAIHRKFFPGPQPLGRRAPAPTERAWNAMIRRCLYPSMHRYPRYGGRGITVCERWRHSFENFLADLGRAPTSSHQLDRIDNNGNYQPNNCRWASRSEQIRNSTKARHITFNGKTQTIGDWAKELGINRQTIQMRLDARKWPVERALGERP